MANRTGTENKRPSRVLMYIYMLFLVIAVIVVIRIYSIQNSWEPNPKFVKEFLPRKHMEEIAPRGGSILDHNGKVLAISTPLYNIFMDCYVQKEHYEGYKDKKEGKRKEEEWLSKADALAGGLAEIIKIPGRDSTYYSNRIRNGRKQKNQNLSMIKGVDLQTLDMLRKLPLFNESPTKGGLIVEPLDNRMYPYDGLARRIIGHVNPNNPDNGYIGIEGTYHREIKGTAGTKWAKHTDQFAWISDIDSTSVEAQDGMDVRTTLDINIQDIADRALRSHVDTARHINTACVVIMDVETGGVRAMVNLKRDSLGRMVESFNTAIGRASEPGSIFKTVILTTLLEEGRVTLDEKMLIDTDEMLYPGFTQKERDQAAFSYKERHKTDYIPVIDGLAVSSNYVFRRQLVNHFQENPEELVARLHSYNLGAGFNFEIQEKGGSKPDIPSPSENWSEATVPSMAIGYSVKVTPLQILTFYNAIANGGRMMKPYIVESFEKNGEVIRQQTPYMQTIVCSEATADTLTRALKRVCSYRWGTGREAMKTARCEVAGKTGTAFIVLEKEERAGSDKPYKAVDGRQKRQASFAGFFPADDPKYSMIVTLYTDLSHRKENGSGKPARVFRDIVNEIWTYDPQWRREITARKENW
jgi:cell division protein FtsI (penicillin-binding protein 3)